MKSSVILLSGPTASGKSELAMRLAQYLNGIIVNADSMLVYDGLRLITARPSVADEAQVPHRLYGYVPLNHTYSVGIWASDVRLEIEKASRERRAIILVGGTGLYFRVLLEGLTPIPQTPDQIRIEVRQRFATMGREAFRAQLATRDPCSAERFNDPQRLIRAAEVVESTGVPLSIWKTRPKVGAISPPNLQKVLLLPPRTQIYERCDQRQRNIVIGGGIREAEEILKLSLDPSLPAMKALGLPYIMEYLKNGVSLEAVIEEVQRSVRNYAKRQYTWFRQQMSDWSVIESVGSEVDVCQVVNSKT